MFMVQIAVQSVFSAHCELSDQGVALPWSSLVQLLLHAVVHSVCELEHLQSLLRVALGTERNGVGLAVHAHLGLVVLGAILVDGEHLEVGVNHWSVLVAQMEHLRSVFFIRRLELQIALCNGKPNHGLNLWIVYVASSLHKLVAADHDDLRARVAADLLIELAEDEVEPSLAGDLLDLKLTDFICALHWLHEDESEVGGVLQFLSRQRCWDFRCLWNLEVKGRHSLFWSWRGWSWSWLWLWLWFRLGQRRRHLLFRPFEVASWVFLEVEALSSNANLELV